MWALIVVISLLVFVGSLAGLLFKNTRGKAKRYAWMSALAMIIAGGFLASEQDDEARRLGFSDNDDRRVATEAEVTDPAVWRAAKEAKKPVQQATEVQTRPLTGDVRDPWRPGEHANDDRWAALITTAPVTLTKTKPCAETGVRMLVGKQFKESSASAADRRGRSTTCWNPQAVRPSNSES